MTSLVPKISLLSDRFLSSHLKILPSHKTLKIFYAPIYLILLYFCTTSYASHGIAIAKWNDWYA